MSSAEIEVFVERLDSDAIDEHSRMSSLFLHDNMSQNPPTENTSKTKKLKKRFKRSTQSTCASCGKIYKNRTTLHNHVLLEHTDAEPSKCVMCDKIYPSRLSLAKHTRYMHLRHRCAVCYKTFEDSLSLSKHTETCRWEEILCEVCGNSYGSVVSLRNHIKYMHPSKTGHWCALCRREFVSEANLINHRNKMHPAGGTDCSCGQQFPSLARLRSHKLYKHSLDSHKCRHCHKAFPTETRLNLHLARLH